MAIICYELGKRFIAGWRVERPGLGITMPRFYFHTNHPSSPNFQDNEGFNFPSVKIAKCEAVKFAGQLLCDVADQFWDVGDFELTVTDAEGLILFTMRMIGTEAPLVRMASR